MCFKHFFCMEALKNLIRHNSDYGVFWGSFCGLSSTIYLWVIDLLKLYPIGFSSWLNDKRALKGKANQISLWSSPWVWHLVSKYLLQVFKTSSVNASIVLSICWQGRGYIVDSEYLKIKKKSLKTYLDLWIWVQ